MTENRDDDGDLGELFEAQRTHDLRRAPTFARVAAGRRGAHRQRSWWPIMVVASAVVAAAIGVMVWPGVQTDARFSFQPGQLRMPTDFLLDAAGMVRAVEMPRIGELDWYPITPSGAPVAATDSGRRQL